MKFYLYGILVFFIILIGSYILFNFKSAEIHFYNIDLVSGYEDVQSNKLTTLAYYIKNEKGEVLKSFKTVHEKIMHFMVVRKDLQNFQHLHPTFDSESGLFSLDILFPTDGQYRIFADFSPLNNQKDSVGVPTTVTIFEDIEVGNSENYIQIPLGSENRVKTFDGYEVALTTHGALLSGVENMLMFSLSQNGKPITDLEPYLGALGHAVILREGSLDFIHAHPMGSATMQQNGVVSFMVSFPEAGKYKLFSQFQRMGKVFTTDFVVEVVQGDGSVDTMPVMDHSMH